MLGLFLLTMLESRLARAVGRGRMTDLLDMPKLTTVVAEWNPTILDKASRGEALNVLLGRVRPALGQLGTTRLRSELEGKYKLTVWVADKIDDGHVGCNLLLFSDEVNWKLLLSQGSLDIRKVESVLDSTSVCPKADTERVEVFLACCVDELDPCLLTSQLRDSVPVDGAALCAVQGLVAFLVTELAFLGRTVSSSVAINSARVAGTSEGTLDLSIRTVGLVVPNLTAVVAFSGEATASRFL
jgi:hypothetical protein